MKIYTQRVYAGPMQIGKLDVSQMFYWNGNKYVIVAKNWRDRFITASPVGRSSNFQLTFNIIVDPVSDSRPIYWGNQAPSIYEV